MTTPPKLMATVIESVARQLRRGLNWMSRHDYVMAALVLTVFLLFFFSWPLLNLKDSYYSAADLAQSYTLLKTRSDYTPGNPLLYDTVVNMQPWMMFNRDILRTGQIPLWNPYNASGAPHAANYQSAVFSIFSLPFYLLDFKYALLLTPFAILFLYGFFSFAFFKQLNIRQIPSLVGALAFMFSGYCLLWLPWVAHIDSGLCLPIGLFCVEWGMRRHQTNPRARHVFWPLVGLTLGIAISLLGGHPETFFAGLLMVASYTLYRLISRFFSEGHNRRAFGQLSRLGAQIICAGLIALGIGAVQVIPFAEYVANSTINSETKTDRAANNISLGVLPLAYFPNMLGTPSGHFRATLNLPFWNYNEANSFHVGSLVTLMALLSVILVRRDRSVRFFAVVALVWFLYFFRLLGVDDLLRLIPGIPQLPAVRSHIIWLFSLSACAALFLNHLFRQPLNTQERNRLLLFITVVAIAFMSLGLGLANQLVLRQSKYLLQDTQNFLSNVPPHITGILITFAIGVLALGLLAAGARYWMRWLASGVILLVVFWQGGYQFKTHMPITPASLYYPVSPAVEQIQHTVGDATIAILGHDDDTIPADLNMVYHLYLLSNKDAIFVAHLDRLFRDFFGEPFGTMTTQRTVSKISQAGLRLFSVEYVVVQNNAARPLDGSLRLDPVAAQDTHTIYRVVDSLPRYYTVSNAVIAQTDTDAWEMVHADHFDPAQSVILSAAGQAAQPISSQASQTPVQVVSEQASRVTLKATRATSGYLVLAKTFYPGWKATVNGIAQPVLRANYAFSAIHLDAGDSEIVYYYDPDSVRYGLLISVGSLTLGLALIAVWIISRRRKAVLPSTSSGGGV